MNGPGARASSHDYATAQASATDWRQPPPTKPHQPSPIGGRNEARTTRREHAREPSLVVEQHRAKHPVTERLMLGIHSARVAVRCVREGFVLHPTRLPGAQQGRRYLRGLAVGMTPLFDDGRALPAWPKTETSDGTSIRLEIDCPDETEVQISLS